ncbi:hypothetical protein [Rhizobium leguminosarum]|uniref:hypothetical protein n=1 Tax=Rhizobium leguminosarum TaxID=384 RepID=UPI0014410B93|nr:hypothetical protein [Rhizobium leguminosarum bv. viciae]NKL09608.1 hypothetical protein [Rhizobium leguminosarum bv. viciae]NKL87746.1 hypothetical protein [Rhizobium leguminosarum bv. viciae]NKL94845.1 hypothetical protein [Rhizobium leguminosarum bv. viciae]NKM95624.1 hypothetical protein [Rhizobium leguminosarum bv. viciae]
MFRFALHALIILILTLLTQIGGIAYLAALAASRAWGLRRFLAKLTIFLLCYAGATFAASLAAPIFGRVPLSCIADATDRLVVRSSIYCLLNRNYVTPELRDLAKALAAHMDKEFPGTITVALDANFPFVNGFPLLPHLSHADGKKLDFAYYYKDADGAFLNGATRSPIGYFAFEQPAPGDELPCEGRNDWLTTRWNFDALQPLFPAYRIEVQRTSAAIGWLTSEGVTRFGPQKIFIEPHLKNALGITDSHIRFQGCRAARHDDHIHIQVD